MDILTRLKIGVRLTLGFAAVLALTILVGLFSVNRLGKVNEATGPVVYSVGTTAFLAVLYFGRRFFVQPMVAWAGLMLSLVLICNLAALTLSSSISV